MKLYRLIIGGMVAANILSGCTGNSDKTLEASGTIEGTDVDIAAEVSGKVRDVFVDEGTRVNRGDTLVIIDGLDYEIQLRQAIANQDFAEAQYRLALEGARKEDILQAEAAFKTAEADYLRVKELLTSRTVTQKQFDEAEARYISAQQTYEKLKRGSRSQEIAAARARRDQAVAQTDLIRKKVNDCILVSPTAGIVTLKAVEPGELVTPGSNLLRVTFLEKVHLMIYVSESELGRVRLGQKVGVNIDTYADRTFDGKVVYISPVAEFTPKNVQTKEERTKLVFGVKIQVENPGGELKPGLPADAFLATE